MEPFDLSGSHVRSEIVRPDVSLKVPYAAGSVYKNSAWDTFHKRNPYSERTITIFAYSEWSPPEAEETRRMLSIEDLDIEDLIRNIKADRELPLRHRNALKVKTTAVHSWDDQPLRVSGSQGFYTCWVEEEDNMDDSTESRWMLRFASLRDPNRNPEMGWEVSSESLGTLELPICMAFVSRVLAFCDEAATLYILTEGCSRGCCTRALRIFEY